MTRSYIADFAFLLRERDGSVRAIEDRHVEGLFARDRWLELLTGAGLAARSEPLVLSDVESGRHEMFVGRPRWLTAEFGTGGRWMGALSLAWCWLRAAPL